MTTIYKYRVYCNADAKYVYTWAETPPTKCPENTNHTINTVDTTIVDIRDESLVSIKEESVPTGGNYQCTTILIDCPPHSTITKDTSWPYPVSVYSIYFMTKAENEGSIINAYAFPPMPIGVIIAPLYAGTKVLHVNSTVFQFMQIGYHVDITDGVHSDDLGEVISIDPTNSTITTTLGPVNNYSPLSPTYIKIKIYRIKNLVIGAAGKYTIGKIKTVGASIPANIPVRTVYTNTTDVPNRFMATLEYTY